MSALSYAPPLTGALPERRPGLGLLVAVEVRKLVDTRSGRWLAGLIVLSSLLANVLMLAFSPGASLKADQMFQLTLVPAGLLLPVLGILTVTTEWSQRTSLTTFALVPARHRVGAAKLLAAAGWALLSWLAAAGVAEVSAAAVRAFHLGDGSARIPWGMFLGGGLYQVLVVVLGVGFGMALLSTPLAIVLYFVLPTGLAALNEAVPRVEHATRWLDIGRATNPLLDGAMTGLGWQRLAVSTAAWVLLPVAFGLWRLSRREVS